MCLFRFSGQRLASKAHPKTPKHLPKDLPTQDPPRTHQGPTHDLQPGLAGFAKRLEFVDDDGTYRIVSIKTTKSDLRDPNFFSIDDLVKYGRINQKAPKITFDPNVIYDGVNNLVGWAILNKNEVINHTLSEKLGLKTQTRSGKATFPKTIADINESIDEDGYDYRSFQPAVSVLDEPIEFEGLTYKYVVRDGNNRYETAWQYFPCAVIQGESEYYLRHYGAVANNPVANELKNNITEDDVKTSRNRFSFLMSSFTFSL